MKNKTITFRSIAAALILFSGIGSAQADFGPIEDRLKIQDIWARYVIMLDSANGEEFIKMFTEDAVLNVNNIDIIKGRADIKAMVDSMGAMPGISDSKFGSMRHIVTSLSLDIQGDIATADSYWMEVMATATNVQPVIFNVGRYEDEYVKIQGQWYFSRRDILADIGYVPEFGMPE